jgi:hypothetical protein
VVSTLDNPSFEVPEGSHGGVKVPVEASSAAGFASLEVLVTPSHVDVGVCCMLGDLFSSSSLNESKMHRSFQWIVERVKWTMAATADATVRSRQQQVPIQQTS